jgi:hypothetical protein
MGWGLAAAALGSVIGGKLASDSADKTLESQEDQLASNQAFIKEQAAKSRADVLPRFDAAQQNRDQGFQGALDVFGQTLPQQADVFQQGNMGAQQALMSGQQQFQNAIMGLPVDYGFMQPQALDYNMDWAQQQLPQAQGTSTAIEDERMGNVLGGITSNADLFRAASEGGINNISEQDQNFWRKHLANVEGTAGGSGARFVNNPQQALPGVMGVKGGFNTKNENRLAHLLTQFQNMGNT